MKRIKLFEEYRAMGFQYSEPKQGFTIEFSLDDSDELDLEGLIKDILVKNDIKYSSIEVDGWDIEIDVNVYIEREMQSVVDSILKGLGMKKVYVDTNSIQIEPKV